jgi:hypothetical protein
MADDRHERHRHRQKARVRHDDRQYREISGRTACMHFQQHDLAWQRPDARGAGKRKPQAEAALERERAETDHAGSEHCGRHAERILHAAEKRR